MDWKELYPFAPHFADTPDGFKIHYVDEGVGEPMVMVHGNPTWSFFFRKVIQDASGHGYRAIAPDMLGCGLSDKPQQAVVTLDRPVKAVRYCRLDETVLPDTPALAENAATFTAEAKPWQFVSLKITAGK